MKRIWALVSATALLLAGAGCGLGSSTKVTPGTPIPTAQATDPVELATFYAQKAGWKPCERAAKMQCAQVKVPLDYTKPNGKTITIAMAKMPAEGKSLGSLFINPGGPGSSGIEFLGNAYQRMIGANLKTSFDIIGFDPRGVGQSTPIRCLNDKETDDMRAEDYDTSTPQGRELMVKAAQKYGDLCLKRSPDMTRFSDTTSAVRDIDILRASVGDSRLNFLGYSYGTYLGLRYSELFPARVGRFVLDGVLDPSASYYDVGFEQAKGFEQSLREFVRRCLQHNGCPVNGTVDQGVAQIQAFFTSLKKTPLHTQDSDRKLTYALGFNAIVAPLYSVTMWPTLEEALKQGMNRGDGSQLLWLADTYADRNNDGTYTTNSNDAFVVINNLDYPAQGDESVWNDEAEKIKTQAPIFGDMFTWGDMYLRAWPVQSTNKRTLTDPAKLPPMLLIGTIHDPATPYGMAQRVAKQMPQSRLLTWQGWDHTAYGHGSKCIDSKVETYLINGVLPEAGKTCPDKS